MSTSTTHEIPAASMAGFNAAETYLATAECDGCLACKCIPHTAQRCTHYVCINRPATSAASCSVAQAAERVERAAVNAYVRQQLTQGNAPTARDIVELNGGRLVVEYIGTGEYSIAVVSPTGERFALDRSELSLARPAVRGGSPAVWLCWSDENGRRF
jgi:hypothetical protein